MNILCIGDIVGRAGRNAFIENIDALKKEHAVDCVIVNAENAAGGAGLTPRIAKSLFHTGCDVITLGDHVWDREELGEYMNGDVDVIRPANFPPGAPGRGWTIIERDGVKIGVINLLGRVFMRYNVDCPFRMLEDIVAEIRQHTNIIIVDFHTETTSEKVALGLFIDGKVSAVVGTHTHIQTADEKVLPNGTAYITDLGMSGPYDSVIGQNKNRIIKRFLTARPSRFEVAKEGTILCGVVINIDSTTGMARTITRIQKPV